MEIEKVEKVVIDGGNVTMNIPINIDQKVVEDFIKMVNAESFTQKQQNELMISRLTEIAGLLESINRRI